MIISFVALLLLFLTSCSRNSSNDSLSGAWEMVFLDSESQNINDSCFCRFCWTSLGFEKVKPVLFFEENNLMRYDLGFDCSSSSWKDNFCEFKIGNRSDFFELSCVNCKKQYSILFDSDSLLCFYHEGKKCMCFSRISEQKKLSCDEFSVFLNLSTGFLYDFQLFLNSFGAVKILRSGPVEDTIYFELDEFDKLYLLTLVSHLDFDKCQESNDTVGGDHSVYEISLECDNTFYYCEINNIYEASFEWRAFIVNINKLIRRSYVN